MRDRSDLHGNVGFHFQDRLDRAGNIQLAGDMFDKEENIQGHGGRF